jgi:hypothetical protein
VDTPSGDITGGWSQKILFKKISGPCIPNIKLNRNTQIAKQQQSFIERKESVSRRTHCKSANALWLNGSRALIFI